MIRKLYFTLFVLLPLSLSAQSSWTLKSCIAYGLVANRSNGVYLNEKLADYLRPVIPAGVFGSTLKKDLDKVTVDYDNALSQIRVVESNLTLSHNQLNSFILPHSNI